MKKTTTARVYGDRALFRGISTVASAVLFLAWAATAAAAGDKGAGVGAAAGGQQAPFVVVLGVAQDGGYPQAGCRKPCCAAAWENAEKRRHVVCLAVVDPLTSQRWLFDATPDFKEQLRMLDGVFPVADNPGLSGIFLSHAHIGHYTGLMHLGREAMGAKDVPVYALPRMTEFLRSNGPWDQLVKLGNISLREIRSGAAVKLNERITVVPFLVPHRDEYTETVGYRIKGPNGSAIYITDIDKWQRWEVSIEELIPEVSVAFLDATFYSEGEIPGRNMADIPHPFIVETMTHLDGLSREEKNKVRFIHLNHTNPVMVPGSEARKYVEEKHFRVAEEMDTFEL